MQFTFIGGGGHCRSLLRMLPENMKPVGYTDVEPIDGMPLPWLGDDSHASGPIHVTVALGRDDSLALRRKLLDKFTDREFVSLIADTAIIAEGSVIGAGSAVLHGAIINGAKIGKNCIINSGAILEHDASLGENCFVGPGAIICGGVNAGSDIVIGAGATVRNGVAICSGATVGMGAVVTRDIVEPGTYLGIPAHKI